MGANCCHTDAGSSFEAAAAAQLCYAHPLRQSEFYEAVTKAYPKALTQSMYKQPELEKPLFKMSRRERRDLFVSTLTDMIRDVMRGDRAFDEIGYDHTRPRLWSFALQAVWEVKDDSSQSQLQCLESLIAVHTGTWGIGLVLDSIQDLLDNELELYLLWKELEIRVVMMTLQRYPNIPCIAVNLRPTEFMQERLQTMVLDATKQLGPRISFELTEYTSDVHFEKLFGTEGSLRERLEKKLLPVLKSMKEAGVTLIADDLKPLEVYRFEDESSFKSGVTLESSHATTCELMLSEEWRGLFARVKFSIDWIIHSMRLSKGTGEDYAKVPLFSFNVKDKPSHVAAATGATPPLSQAQEAEALSALQDKAASALRQALPKAKELPQGPVIEATLPRSVISEWGLDSSVGEQGGLLFEAKFPPAWYFGAIS